MLTPRTPLALSASPFKPKPRATLAYLTPRAYAKASRKSIVSMTYRPTSRAIKSLKHPGFPKDKDPIENKSGAIYWFQGGERACDEEYIGETSRTFGKDLKNT